MDSADDQCGGRLDVGGRVDPAGPLLVAKVRREDVREPTLTSISRPGALPAGLVSGLRSRAAGAPGASAAAAPKAAPPPAIS